MAGAAPSLRSVSGNTAYRKLFPDIWRTFATAVPLECSYLTRCLSPHHHRAQEIIARDPTKKATKKAAYLSNQINSYETPHSSLNTAVDLFFSFSVSLATRYSAMILTGGLVSSMDRVKRYRTTDLNSAFFSGNHVIPWQRTQTYFKMFLSRSLLLASYLLHLATEKSSRWSAKRH